MTSFDKIGQSHGGDGRFNILKILPSPEQIRDLCDKLGMPVAALEARWAKHAQPYQNTLLEGDGVLAWQHAQHDRAHLKLSDELVGELAEALRRNPDVDISCAFEDVAEKRGSNLSTSFGLVYIQTVLSNQQLSNYDKVVLFNYLLTPPCVSGASASVNSHFTPSDVVWQRLGYVVQAALAIKNIDQGAAQAPDFVREILAKQLGELLQAINSNLNDYSCTSEEFVGQFTDCADELEQVEIFLLDLGRNEPACGQLCQRLLAEWRNIRNGEGSFRFLESAFDLLPPTVPTYDIDVESVIADCELGAKALSLEFRMLEALKPMAELPVWSNSIGEISAQLDRKQVVQINGVATRLLESDQGKKFLDYIFDQRDESLCVFIGGDHLRGCAPSSVSPSEVVEAFSAYLRHGSRNKIRDDLSDPKKTLKLLTPTLDFIDYLKDKLPGVSVQVADSDRFKPFGQPVVWLGDQVLCPRVKPDDTSMLRCSISIVKPEALSLGPREIAELSGEASGPLSALNRLQKTFETVIIPQLMEERPGGLSGSVGYRVGELEARSLKDGFFQLPPGSDTDSGLADLRPLMFKHRGDTLRICLIKRHDEESQDSDPKTEQNDLNGEPEGIDERLVGSDKE
jgi:hypothetical protein